MSDELKPVPCGCGGEAKIETVTTHFEQRPRFRIRCEKCNISTIWDYWNEAEAIEAWNRAMGHRDNLTPEERTAKVIEHDASVTDTDGYKYHRSEYLCGACKKKVLGGDEYCSHCGCRLEWE